MAELMASVTVVVLYHHFLLLQEDLGCGRLGLTGRQTLLHPTLTVLFVLAVLVQQRRLFVRQSLQL